MVGVVRDVNSRVLGKGLELQSVNDGRSEIYQQLFADDTAVVADSEKLYRLLSEFGRVCKIRKLRVNMGKRSYEVLQKWKWETNARETKWRAVRGSGLF